ncbi:MAG: hypothetical protein A2908_04650 [Candidatus Staskawiczbacteria bacterium RIFCSPLOWO2_01_FULL_38_12b]|uniref:Uncharacterized protein n=1 Tax=Candidatus Staskawiczbacteria bacterium RIFCSPLOWO2_01_FULL_38_12b TaxID=1802214 RepID=A0A1G2IDU8_9BACT|nr:MAG: hypothetical protein A2908_04650 [Candidatus Staskawiczbacteria bacterium RIFCSPLOWO2_01_FULL_38_12b]
MQLEFREKTRHVARFALLGGPKIIFQSAFRNSKYVQIHYTKLLIMRQLLCIKLEYLCRIIKREVTLKGGGVGGL